MTREKRDKGDTLSTSPDINTKRTAIYANQEQKSILQEAFAKSQHFNQEELQRLEKATGLSTAWIRRWLNREQRKMRIILVKEEEKEVHMTGGTAHQVKTVCGPSSNTISSTRISQAGRTTFSKVEITGKRPNGVVYNQSIKDALPSLPLASPPPLAPGHHIQKNAMGIVEPNKQFPAMALPSSLIATEGKGSITITTTSAFPNNLQDLLVYLPCLALWLDDQISRGRHPSVDEVIDQLLELNQALVTEDPLQATLVLYFVRQAGLKW